MERTNLLKILSVMVQIALYGFLSLPLSRVAGASESLLIEAKRGLNCFHDMPNIDSLESEDDSLPLLGFGIPNDCLDCDADAEDMGIFSEELTDSYLDLQLQGEPIEYPF